MLLSNLAVVITTSFVLVQCHDCKDYDLSASDQSLIDMMKHYLHTSRKEQGLSTGKQGASGVTYVRWGKKECTKQVDIVYTGQVGGNYFTNKGGGVNYLCLPNDPENGEPIKGDNDQLFGAEYQIASSFRPSGMKGDMTQKEVPCAVCFQRKRSTVLMIPGRKTCYKGWTFEYTGYLMSDYKDYSYKDYACVDKDAEPVDNKTSDENGALFYGISTKCGSLRCPPYKNGVSVKCVVCTK
ncbi:short-chain collagen C4-like [Mytilus trossulus]|uniref:short-chain collagen C4-like n=1 Tax=Mytilus trossulus TaxID=6551 RepID=UPI00300799F5